MIDINIEENVRTLELVNHQLAELKEIKDKLESKILKAIGRVEYADNGEILAISKEGQATERHGKYAITVKTEYLYAINKEEYAVFKNKIPAQYNPIQEKVTLEVNKRVLKDAEKYASAEELLLLGNIITKKFAKPAIKCSLNV